MAMRPYTISRDTAVFSTSHWEPPEVGIWIDLNEVKLKVKGLGLDKPIGVLVLWVPPLTEGRTVDDLIEIVQRRLRAAGGVVMPDSKENLRYVISDSVGLLSR